MSSLFHIERDGHHSHYTCISNAVIMDKRISLAARGFFTVVLSLSDRWDFSVNGMARLVGVNKDTVLRYIRELEQLGYVRIESRDEAGRYARKSYTFYENGVPDAAAEQGEVTENTAVECAEVPQYTAPKETVPKKTAQTNTNTTKTINKQNNISIGQGDEKNDISFLEKRINADKLREEYGSAYIDTVVGVIKDCMKAKSRTISGESVDNTELVRVFSEVCEEDIRRSVQAVKGKRCDNFAGYYGSVLFNQIRNRLEQPQPPQQSVDEGGHFASIDMDEVMRRVMAKYMEG